MIFKLSNKSFYDRHNYELDRFTIYEDTLHIVNAKSEYKILSNNESDLCVIDFENEDIDILSRVTKKYSVIVLTDIIEATENIFKLFQIIKSSLVSDGKLVISSVNTKWSFLIKIFGLLKLKDTDSQTSYIHLKKIKNVANGVGLEYISSISRQYFPFKFFYIGTFLNKVLELLFFYLNFGIKTYIVFRNQEKATKEIKKTIIIPAKNEEGNLDNLFNRIPKERGCEIIFACGESEDKTIEVAKRIQNSEKTTLVKVFQQSKNGKANAVWEALDISEGDIIAILDADISVDPEELPKFFEIIEKNQADFVNGTRLIYEMEPGSMRLINKAGNRVFQFVIGMLIKVELTDSLCGTKVFKRDLIKKIKWWQTTFKVKDPFGDFDLLFTAAYTGQKILEYPIHYRARTYGKTQISRFKDGFKLVKYILKSYKIFNSSNL